MKQDRKVRIESSNNKTNPYKNVCALAVAQYFNIDNNVRYLHTLGDLQRAFSKGTTWFLKSRSSGFKGKTVGQIRNKVYDKIGAMYYVVIVEGHVLVLDRHGKTIVDTDPRDRDARKIVTMFGVFHRNQCSMFDSSVKHIKHFENYIV